MRLFYIIILLFASFTSASGLTAGFTASFTEGCSPLVVNFTNTSTGATSYSWNLGNGTITPLTNPSTSYLAVGTYTVTLTAYSGSSSSVHTMVITVHPLPTASFTASDTTICPGTNVFFNSTSVGGVPGPMTYAWGFGDGGVGTGASPSHIYSTPGSYNVTLSVTNAQGCIKTLTKVGHVVVYPRPTASFAGSPLSICNPPGTVNFTNSSAGALPLSYLWSFGSGPASTAATPSNIYSIPGTYTVRLVVTDGFGCKDSLTRPSYIFVGDAVASFTLPATACVGAPVTFTNTSGTHTSRTWNYGDGSAAGTSLHGTRTYSTPGTYTVTLTIVNGPCTDVETHTITVLPPIAASFSISPIHPCPAPVTLFYTGSVPAGCTVSWEYEGGGTGSGTSGFRSYTTNGVKTVKMIVTDPMGCVVTVVKKDTIYDMIFNGHADPREGCVPLSVDFDVTPVFTSMPDTTLPLNVYPLPVVSYVWNYGDGSPLSSGASPTHIYTAVGIYIATVTATTSNGCSISDTIRIRVGAPPVVTFSISPTHVCYGDYVSYTAVIISGPVDRYDWRFSSGMVSTGGPFYSHMHVLPGVHTTTLTPYYMGCPGLPYVSSITVTVDSPKADIRLLKSCSPLTTVSFFDSSLGCDSHLWMFGDGTTSTAEHPVHNYPTVGTYTVKLATYNSTSGCRDTTEAVVILTEPPIDFAGHDTAICKGDTVRFSAIYPPGGKPSAFKWFVNGVSDPWMRDSAYTDTFTAGGYYTVMLVVLNINNCWDTVTKTNYIVVGDPDAHFTAVPTSGCRPLTVTFTDASTNVTGVPFSSYAWSFGGSASSVVTTPVTTHIYTAAGTFTVSLTVTDVIGCVDSAFFSPIRVYRPTAAFTASNVHPCVHVPTTFTNTSTGAVSSLWTFGDGATSTVTSPAHAYTAAGVYTVRLVVTDVLGCRDTLTQTAYITVTTPVASFNMSDTFSICPPLLVTFTNTSTGATIYNWTFGDGNISALLSPTNMYTTPGLYPVQLIARDAWGCSDTAYNHLNLYGYSGSLTYTPLTGCTPLLVNFNAAISNVPHIIWDFGDGTTTVLSAVDTVSHVYTIPGSYLPKLILSDHTGCQNSSVGPFIIKVDGITAKFGVSPAACIGSPFNFVDSSTWLWSPVDSWFWTYGGDTASEESPTHLINAPGTYPVTLTVSNGWGCTATLTDNIEVLPLPVVTTSPDTVVCLTDAATLTGFGAATYSWGPPATLGCIDCNPTTATPSVVSTYSVIGTDVHGCKDTASVKVALRTHTFAKAWGDTTICFGGSVQMFDTGGYFYKWTPSGGLNSNTIYNPIASPGSSTSYTVVAQLGSCIPDTDYVQVDVRSLPTVNAGIDQEIIAGSIAKLTATGLNIATYEWSPKEGLSCFTCYNPDATVLETTTYTVEVTSPFGCKATDDVKIYLFCNSKQVFVPTVFTPNGDGENDVFYPRGTGITVIKSFRIYNRWGELLFERANINVNDASNAWDGSYQGGPPKADVFVYVIDAVCSTGQPVMIKGDVTIIR
jgi:gliding motility-associated-like protein